MNSSPTDFPVPDQVDLQGLAPLTGAYFWLPRPRRGGVAWELVTCHDLRVHDGISHREFWPVVLQSLANRWRKDPRTLAHLRGHYNGLPRGRITHPNSAYIVIHGDDAPVSDWLELVKVRFQLTGVEVIPEYTEYETMLDEDHEAVQSALGVDLEL